MGTPERQVRGYAALANLLREDIANGTLPPGGRFPSERELTQRFGLGRDTVRDAVQVLRAEGLIVVRHGHATTVVDFGEKTEQPVAAGSTVEARMPTPEERTQLGMPEGWPVLHVRHPDGSGDLYPAHLYCIRIPDVAEVSEPGREDSA